SITSCLLLVKNTVVCLPAILSGRLCPVIQGAAPTPGQPPFWLLSQNLGNSDFPFNSRNLLREFADESII
ncbi:hypothetical protein, partial [Burkholderia oklahomensis]|uniref:hypothetical protein n=1 Tax=Burkholderia oklahomensis TaxID=342113 RepID=UPI001ABB78B5